MVFILYILQIHLLVHNSSWLSTLDILTLQNIHCHCSSFNDFKLNSTYLLRIFVLEILCFPSRSSLHPFLFCSVSRYWFVWTTHIKRYPCPLASSLVRLMGITGRTSQGGRRMKMGYPFHRLLLCGVVLWL